jgi:hypothetical protein
MTVVLCSWSGQAAGRPDVCLQLNMFWAFSRPSSRAQWLQWKPFFLPSYRNDSRVVFVVGSGDPPDFCLQLNMFWSCSRPSSGAQWLQWQPMVLPSYRGDSRLVFVVGPGGRPDICLQLNMFWAFFRPSSGAQWLQWQPLVLPSYRGDNRPARPRTQHDYHHDTKVKPEAATAVIELLTMGAKKSETCWAVNKRQDNKMKYSCIRLVIYLNCTIIHGLTNLKFYI